MQLRTNFLVAVLLLASSSPSVLLGQEFPVLKPGKAHAILAADAGTWECEMSMYLSGPDGEPTKFKAIETNKMVSGGLYQMTEFRAKMGDRDFEGHALIGYNPSKKTYQGTWVDNFTAAPTNMSGVYDKEKKTLTLTGTVLDEEGGEYQQKQVTTWLSKKSKRFEIFMLFEEQGEEIEIRLLDMKATKKD